MTTQTTTIINGKKVGNGKWKLQSAKNYCQKKGIALSSLQYQSYHINYGFDYETVNIETGEQKFAYNSDPARTMLGI